MVAYDNPFYLTSEPLLCQNISNTKEAYIKRLIKYPTLNYLSTQFPRLVHMYNRKSNFCNHRFNHKTKHFLHKKTKHFPWTSKIYIPLVKYHKNDDFSPIYTPTIYSPINIETSGMYHICKMVLHSLSNKFPI